MSRRYKKLVHEGEYAAEVEVDLIATDEGWSPYLPLEDAERLDAVREALRPTPLEDLELDDCADGDLGA